MTLECVNCLNRVPCPEGRPPVPLSAPMVNPLTCDVCAGVVWVWVAGDFRAMFQVPL